MGEVRAHSFISLFTKVEMLFGHSGSHVISVVTGRARLLGFRVGFVGQNPSLRTLRLSGFGPFWASGFFGLCQAFVDHVKHEVDLFS